MRFGRGFGLGFVFGVERTENAHTATHQLSTAWNVKGVYGSQPMRNPPQVKAPPRTRTGGGGRK